MPLWNERLKEVRSPPRMVAVCVPLPFSGPQLHDEGSHIGHTHGDNGFLGPFFPVGHWQTPCPMPCTRNAA